jgi:membrane protease subunit (stomatin/prohibitin family)
MALLDLIECTDPHGNELVQRRPTHGSGEFRLGSQCVVREGQLAIFVQNGVAADLLGPGRHTLNTYNIPLLSSLIGTAFGGRSPFRAEVYFISTRLFTDLKWGTTQPILVRDPQLGAVRLRAFGMYALQVSNPSMLVKNLVAARGLYTTSDIEGYLRTIILQHLSDVVAEYMTRERVSVLDLSSQYNELSALATAALQDEFAMLGLMLQRLFISSMTLPAEVEERLDAATSVNLFGGIDSYTRYKAAEALGNMGSNEAAGAVVGLGLGHGLTGLAGQSIYPTLAQGISGSTAATCCQCQGPLPAGARFCPMCGTDQQARRPATKHCARCTTELAPAARFCTACGTAA